MRILDHHEWRSAPPMSLVEAVLGDVELSASEYRRIRCNAEARALLQPSSARKGEHRAHPLTRCVRIALPGRFFTVCVERIGRPAAPPEIA